jgi:hypothetical protein
MVVPDDVDEVFSCMINFTRSMGATTVLAMPPAHAPATASLAGENDLVEDSADTADDVGAPPPTAADVWFMSICALSFQSQLQLFHIILLVCRPK